MAEEYKEALLEKQNYHDGCPGCKVEKMKQLRRGYPTSSFPSFGSSFSPLIFLEREATRRGVSTRIVYGVLLPECDSRGRSSSHVQAIPRLGGEIHLKWC